MDKASLLHTINGLRRRLRAGKSLRSACTVLGQQIGSQKNGLFCTSGAVDMQRLFHRRLPVTATRPAVREVWRDRYDQGLVRVTDLFCTPFVVCNLGLVRSQRQRRFSYLF